MITTEIAFWVHCNFMLFYMHFILHWVISASLHFDACKIGEAKVAITVLLYYENDAFCRHVEHPVRFEGCLCA